MVKKIFNSMRLKVKKQNFYIYLIFWIFLVGRFFIFSKIFMVIGRDFLPENKHFDLNLYILFSSNKSLKLSMFDLENSVHYLERILKHKFADGF